MSGFKGFFTGLTIFNQEKRNTLTGSGYENVGKSINEYTDLATNVDNFNYKSNSTSVNPFNQTNFNNGRADYLNSVYAKVRAAGAKVYMSFAPVNKDACSETAKNPATHEAYIKKINEMLDITVISDPADYMLEEKWFNNSDSHPGIEGSKMRTAQLIADLKAQLALEAGSQ